MYETVNSKLKIRTQKIAVYRSPQSEGPYLVGSSYSAYENENFVGRRIHFAF